MTNYKIAAPLVLFVGILFFMINHCTQIASCAMVFTLLMFTINFTCKIFGAKKSLQISFAYLIINIVIFNNSIYTINGQLFSYLIPVSLFAVFISSAMSVKVIKSFENKIGFAQSNLIAICTAALVDAFFMSMYFLNYFSVAKILTIATKEISSKLIYSLIIFGIFTAISYLIKKQSSVKIHARKIMSDMR